MLCPQNHSEKLLINHGPHVEYCSSVWDPHTRLSDTQKIERIQRQAARYVTGDYRRSSSVSEMLYNLKWTNLSTRRSVTQTHYDLQNPERSFCHHSKQFLWIRRRVKNITSLFVHYQPRGNIDKYAFVQRSIPEWNTLPNVIVQDFKPTRRSSSGSCSRNTYSKTRCLHWHSI